jgi:hypothetical protein
MWSVCDEECTELRRGQKVTIDSSPSSVTLLARGPGGHFASGTVVPAL